jgi:hypothetical protein
MEIFDFEHFLRMFQSFKTFKPPPSSSPATRGRKEVGERALI